ncbi:MAG TPA: tetratricopeptide repeat protein [Herpetosiphonaceae bacterium]|nr:tetratricopeptide repeat protein [Herpetosiphonaceae bacterium]
MTDLLSFGPWLKQRRRHHDFTQARLAAAAGCSVATIKKIEAGDLLASRELAELLGKALDVPAAELPAFVTFARSERQTAAPDAFQARAAAPAPRGHPGSPAAPQPEPPAYFLPAQMTAVIGRERETAAVCALLRQPHVRLLTLTGPPGTGKTRLSLEAAGILQAELAAGACFVQLAPVTDPAVVASVIAAALGVKESANQPALATLQGALRERQLLLVLDNFEQVLDGAIVVKELLAAAPRLKVLASSREPLHLYGEQEFPVPPLGVPDIQRLPPPEALTMFPAVELFIQRAQAVKPDFAVTAANALDVASICAWLEGLPLAIEMAAAHIKWTPPAALFAQLQDRLAVLTGGPRDLTPRQQTLRGAIDWSYDRLDAAAQRLLRGLAVFVGDYSQAAVAAIVGETPGGGPLGAQLAGLVEKNLLRYDTAGDGEARFSMLETIRAYGAEKLAAAGEDDGMRGRHAEYFCGLAEQAAPNLLTGEHQRDWLNRLAAEYPNIRLALAWTLEGRGDATLGQRLADAMFVFWHIRSTIDEGGRWLETAAARTDEPSELRARVLSRAGTMATWQGRYERSITLQEQALAIQERLNDQAGISRSLQNLAIIAGMHGEYERARELLERSLVIERADDRKPAIGTILNNLALVAQRQHDYARAEALLTEAIILRAEISDSFGMSNALHTLGVVRQELGRLGEAAGVFGQGLKIRQDLGDKRGIAVSLEHLASVSLLRERPELAARLYAAATALRDSLAAPQPPDARAIYERDLAALKEQLGPAAFSAAWNQGASAPLSQIIDLALAG